MATATARSPGAETLEGEVDELFERLKVQQRSDYQLLQRYLLFLRTEWEKQVLRTELDKAKEAIRDEMRKEMARGQKPLRHYLFSRNAITLWIFLALMAPVLLAIALRILSGEQVVRVVEILAGATGVGAGAGAGYGMMSRRRRK